jgi:hypothetical protein
MRRKHPITVIAHDFRNRQAYEAIASDAEAYWRKLLPSLGDDGLDILVAAHGRAVARAARCRDKLNTFKNIISSAMNIENPSDEDALALLAGWTVHNVVSGEEE